VSTTLVVSTTSTGAAQVCPAAVQGVAGSACGFLAKVWRAAKEAKERTSSPPTTTTGRDGR
jgi:hypothetical protein